MCLGTKLSDRSLARYKAKGKKTGYIRVWKCVMDVGDKYTPWLYDRFSFRAGLNKAYENAANNDQLVHAFCNEKSALGWKTSEIIIECFIKPEWVKEIGNETNWTDFTIKTLTTKAIVMPAYPKCKVTVSEFRKAIKGKKIKKYSWE